MAGFPEHVVAAAFPGRPAFQLSDAGLLAALQWLGATPAGVADRLFAGGYRGRPGCEGQCPVALWLADCWPDVTVAVDKSGVEVLDVRGLLVADAALPDPVREFIAEYDRPGSGRFAHLVRDEEQS